MTDNEYVNEGEGKIKQKGTHDEEWGGVVVVVVSSILIKFNF